MADVKVYSLAGNQLMSETIRQLWEGLSEDAKMRLYSASARHALAVEEQHKLFNDEMLAIKKKIKKHHTLFEYHDGMKVPLMLQD
ncbi:hypothetical protein OUZ56_003166 [Daphnia magna]|uniref:Uncharacterized protein n=1 Tax=Daphnia magna TaxID=35525 RepID=A0ABR0A7X7_9CRUS|nr:hypothetical protein OUZ56_003166 [Daphnia magna]